MGEEEGKTPRGVGLEAKRESGARAGWLTMSKTPKARIKTG